jgi:hypothetical protein
MGLYVPHHLAKAEYFDVLKQGYLFCRDNNFLVLSKKSFLTLNLPMSHVCKDILFSAYMNKYICINIWKDSFIFVIWKTLAHESSLTFDLC